MSEVIGYQIENLTTGEITDVDISHNGVPVCFLEQLCLISARNDKFRVAELLKNHKGVHSEWLFSNGCELPAPY